MSIVKYGTPTLSIPQAAVLTSSSPTKLSSSDNMRSLTNGANFTPRHSALSTNTTSNINTNSNQKTSSIANHHHHQILSNGINTNSINNHLYSNVAYSNMMSGYSSNSDSIYPKIVTYPYPKPGGINPIIHIHIADLQSNNRNHKQISPPREIGKM